MDKINKMMEEHFIKPTIKMQDDSPNNSLIQHRIAIREYLIKILDVNKDIANIRHRILIIQYVQDIHDQLEAMHVSE